ncbi:MAG: ribonuclease III [Rikenellaceae bacterium]|nr:ribonuclease III [Rikenellaceae bacterium]
MNFLLRPFKLRFGADKEYYRAIHKVFGICPDNIELYKLALIHRSASITLEDGRTMNNERLEFLGDAVLESIVSDYLFIEFPDKSEGFLTKLRSKIVSRSTLNSISTEIGLNQYVVLQHNAAHSQKHLYGDAFEAMIGAIYLDKGYNFINRLIINKFLKEFFNIDELIQTETDFKSRVIEWAQKYHKQIRFETEPAENYSENMPVFKSLIVINNREEGCGRGSSKKEAEQAAAKAVMDKINSVDEN